MIKITLPKFLLPFQTKDIYLKMLNDTITLRNISFTEEPASTIEVDEVMTSLSVNLDVTSDSDLTVQFWLQKCQLIITLLLLVFGK